MSHARKRSDHQQLLLPATPLFIWASLLVALFLNFLPLGRVVWRPDFVMLVLLFWVVHEPRRIGMGCAFVLGLCMDVQEHALLGQNALAYVVLSYFALVTNRRLLWYGVWEQSILVLPLFVLGHILELVLRLMAGSTPPGWQLLLAPCIETALWPFADALLLAPQRRAPDPDENRAL